jgi:hypothetical protein
MRDGFLGWDSGRQGSMLLISKADRVLARDSYGSQHENEYNRPTKRRRSMQGHRWHTCRKNRHRARYQNRKNRSCFHYCKTAKWGEIQDPRQKRCHTYGHRIILFRYESRRRVACSSDRFHRYAFRREDQTLVFNKEDRTFDTCSISADKA